MARSLRGEVGKVKAENREAVSVMGRHVTPLLLPPRMIYPDTGRSPLSRTAVLSCRIHGYIVITP